MRFTITARLRHGPLWDAVKRHGSASSLAKAIGVCNSTLGLWLNLRAVPGKAAIEKYEKAIIRETGCTFEELFPDEIKDKHFLDLSKTTEITRDIPNHLIAANGQSRFELPSPEDVQQAEDVKGVLTSLLNSLGSREREVIQMRYGVDGGQGMPRSYIGKKLNVTRETISMIEAKAIRKIRDKIQKRGLENSI